jgi:hypothetical protein
MIKTAADPLQAVLRLQASLPRSAPSSPPGRLRRTSSRQKWVRRAGTLVISSKNSPSQIIGGGGAGAAHLASFWLLALATPRPSPFATCAGRRRPICAARAARHARELGSEDRRTWPVDVMDGGRGVRARLCEEFSIEVRPVLEERSAITGQKGVPSISCDVLRGFSS